MAAGPLETGAVEAAEGAAAERAALAGRPGTHALGRPALAGSDGRCARPCARLTRIVRVPERRAPRGGSSTGPTGSTGSTSRRNAKSWSLGPWEASACGGAIPQLTNLLIADR